ncbi:DUF3741-associated sequence motif [Sesbania bispinosa]|nr:DUF3741-associated sequence motif [Sesbania bispinosa]
MNDASGKGSSCLAITEKKNQRPGGCIGIFFQLFDWNRRLTKKRLFSKKLLPPARANKLLQRSLKEMRKCQIPSSPDANENNGGFPSAKKGGNRVMEVEQKHEMRVPGLVARLMGLESIPASQRDRTKNSSFSDGEEKDSLDDHSSEGDKQRVDLEMGVANAKHDSRPQKLQKTGTYERKAVTRFGAEAMQIKVFCHKPEVEISTPIVSDVFTASSLGSAQEGRPFVPSHENDVVLLRSQDKIITLVHEDGENNAHSCNESTTRRMPVPSKWDSSRQPCGALEDDEASLLPSNRKIKYKNGSLSGRTRMRSPTKMDSCKFDLERKPPNRKNDSLSRRNVSSDAQGEKGGVLMLLPQTSGKEETSSDNENKIYLQRPPPLRADALGAILEQKLKELATGGPPKKPTAVILQELISALKSEHLTCSADHMLNDKLSGNIQFLIFIVVTVVYLT